MKHISKLFISACITACCTSVSYASTPNIVVYNNSNKVATAETLIRSHIVCSVDELGELGKLKPHDKPLTIPGWVISSICQKDCEVAVYMSDKCQAPKIATATINSHGIVKAVNNLPNIEGYYLVKKNDNEISIEGGVKTNIFDMMVKKLGV